MISCRELVRSGRSRSACRIDLNQHQQRARLTAQISRFSTHPRRKMIKSFSDQIGGTARGCHRLVDYAPHSASDLDE